MTDQAAWTEINRLFEELVDLAPEDRRSRLAAYGGPEHVRREVEGLLAALSSGEFRLEPSPGASHLTLGGETALLVISLAGRRLGPWAVLREIGRGGMGAVYEAVRADDQFQKRVAVKTLTRGADSAVVARRFQQERQILATLEHPNIATLIDGGVTEEGLPYLVMEFVDGASPIDQYCLAAKLPLRERLDLFRQVCTAVQYAHRNLVVHRDLKPTNVLVSSDGNIKLVDFGIAKLLEGNPLGHDSLTETGLRAFTTSFASPEQVRGDPISTSTDVYSLGAMLYLLVTGRLPLEIAQLTPVEALRRIAEATPPPPSKVCTAEAAAAMGFGTRERLARELAGELDDIVLAALRKEPERRYGTVAAFSDDVKRFLQGQQVSARPDTWRYRVRAFTRRNPRLVVMAAVAVAALVLGTAAATWQAYHAGVARNLAQAEAARSSRVVSFIEQMLATPTQGALTEATVQIIDQAVERARNELADDPIARAAVYRTAANAFAVHNYHDRALPLLDSAMALDRRFRGAESTELGRDLVIAALLAYSRGRIDSAVAHAGTAVRLLKAFPSDRPIDLSNALLYHSFALTYAGRAVEGLAVAREGLDHESRSRTVLLPYFHSAAGEALIFSGDAAGGEREYRRAAALYDSMPPPERVERGIAEMAIANTLVRRGALEEAKSHARKALEVFLRHWGPDHAYTARVHGILAGIALRQGDSATAASQTARLVTALDHGRHGLVDRATIESDLARIYLATGRPELTIQRVSRMLATYREELNVAPHSMSNLESFLGFAYIAAGNLSAAIAPLRHSASLMEKLFGEDHLITRRVASELLSAAAATNDTATWTQFQRLAPPESLQAIRSRARRINPR